MISCHRLTALILGIGPGFALASLLVCSLVVSIVLSRPLVAEDVDPTDLPPYRPFGFNKELRETTGSTWVFRTLNRKQVSRILIERYGNRQAVTMLVSHSLPWSIKSEQHALRLFCGSASECISILKRLDQMLDSGRNLGARLDGSEIKAIDYFPDTHSN